MGRILEIQITKNLKKDRDKITEQVYEFNFNVRSFKVYFATKLQLFYLFIVKILYK